MLYNGSEVIRDLEWVIFDEVHYINDAEVRKRPRRFLFQLFDLLMKSRIIDFPLPLCVCLISSERGCVGGGFDHAS